MNNYIPKGIYQVDGLPLQISALESTNVRLIACGENHFLSLSGMNSFPKKKKQFYKQILANGLLYSWGNGTEGQLGHGNIESLEYPAPIKYFINNQIKILKISANYNQSAVITEKEEIYLW